MLALARWTKVAFKTPDFNGVAGFRSELRTTPYVGLLEPTSQIAHTQTVHSKNARCHYGMACIFEHRLARRFYLSPPTAMVVAMGLGAELIHHRDHFLGQT